MDADLIDDATEQPDVIRVKTLEKVPQEFLCCYVPDPSGGFVCDMNRHPDMIALDAKHAAELAALEAEAAELVTSTAQLRKRNRDDAVSIAIREALRPHGVPP